MPPLETHMNAFTTQKKCFLFFYSEIKRHLSLHAFRMFVVLFRFSLVSSGIFDGEFHFYIYSRLFCIFHFRWWGFLSHAFFTIRIWFGAAAHRHSPRDAKNFYWTHLNDQRFRALRFKSTLLCSKLFHLARNWIGVFRNSNLNRKWKKGERSSIYVSTGVPSKNCCGNGHNLTNFDRIVMGYLWNLSFPPLMEYVLIKHYLH